MHPMESHIISQVRSEELLRSAHRERIAATVPRSRFRLFRRARRVETGTESRFRLRLVVGGRRRKTAVKVDETLGLIRTDFDSKGSGDVTDGGLIEQAVTSVRRLPVTEALPVPDQSVLDQIVAATAVPRNGAAS